MAVLYGLAPAGQGASILQAMETALQTPHGPRAFSSGSGASLISPLISGFDVHAHFEAGDSSVALSLIRTVWAQHMTHDTPFCSGAVFEALGLDGTPESSSTSLAHAWGSGPTSALSKYVLGVRPVKPGYRTWLIEPQTGDLSWAEGTVPTPFGPIQVEWRRTAQGMHLEINVPEGTSGTVGVPAQGASYLLTVNGKPLKGAKAAAVSSSDQAGSRSGYVYVSGLNPGANQIVVTGGDQ